MSAKRVSAPISVCVCPVCGEDTWVFERMWRLHKDEAWPAQCQHCNSTLRLSFYARPASADYEQVTA